MRDEQVFELAAGQFNRVSRAQLLERDYTDEAIEHRRSIGRLISVEAGVYALPPLLDDRWGRWMGATLTADDTHLAHASACAAYGFAEIERPVTTVVRPGNGGPRRHGGLLVYRSLTLAGEVDELRGIPITSPERTLVDLAARHGDRLVGRAFREAVRLGFTTPEATARFVFARRHRRGARNLLRIVARYTGIPIERARSGAEVRAMMILRDAGFELPQLNVRVAGEEADLVWRRHRLILEIDGGPFHLDAGEDARKEARWRGAGFEVRRLPADDVYERPDRLLALVPEAHSSLRPGLGTV